VLHSYSRGVVGWAIDSRHRADLATNALGMAIDSRADPAGQLAGSVIHGDHGTQGGFNWSAQYLDGGGVDGQASGVDAGVDWQGADEVAREALPSTRCGALVLA